jgi:3-carboxy-cis,cis-muconate cycloisomerase
MARGLAQGGGSALAEAAAYALSARAPRAQAQARVKAAVARAAREGRPLAEILAEDGPDGIDWAAALDPAAVAAPARAVIDAVLRRARR